MKFLFPILFVVSIVLATAAIMLAVFYIWQRKIRSRNRRSPLTRNMLRSPGESLRDEIERINDENSLLITFSYFTPLLFYSVTLAQLYFASDRHFGLSMGLATIAVGAILFVLLKLVFQKIEILRRLRLGMEGEIATGEELNQLMLDGCRVFHDIPFEYGNIDHVVIAQSGVYAIETKTLAKSNESGGEKVTVDFDAGIVKFVDWTYRMPIQQLETNARWLQEFLTQATAIQINVESFLALPGYYIEDRVGRGNFQVISPRKPQRFFLNHRIKYSSQQVQQIAHQLEQLCRNVEPSFSKTKTK